MDQHLTWNIHISHIASKVSKNVGILSRIAYLLPIRLRLNLYYSLVHPYLSYCNMVWASNYASRLKRLVLLQNKAVRIISWSFTYESTAQIFYKFKIPKPEQIKIIQTVSLCLNIGHMRCHLLLTVIFTQPQKFIITQ